jgi:hypothetical protein
MALLVGGDPLVDSYPDGDDLFSAVANGPGRALRSGVLAEPHDVGTRTGVQADWPRS